jgi:hypothetical protein
MYLRETSVGQGLLLILTLTVRLRPKDHPQKQPKQVLGSKHY